MRPTRVAALIATAIVGALFVSLVGADAAGVFDAPAGVTALTRRNTAPERLAASVELAPRPLTLACDGARSSTIGVHVRDDRGRDASNGMVVEFESDDGSLSEREVETRKGIATSVFTPNGFASKPVVRVSVGDLETSVALRCLAQEPCAPTSPPQPFSPPCGGSPGCTPAFSPPQTFSPPCTTRTPEPPGCEATSPPPVMSPPCATPTPDCTNAFSPPQPFSPPCVPVAPLWLQIDCDVATDGVETSCPLGVNAETFSAGVVLSNRSADFVEFNVFQFEAHANGRWLLNPLPGVDSNRNGNPDLNEETMTDAWTCAPPAPEPDTGEDGPDASVSFISCYLPANDSFALAPGESVSLATIHYGVEPATNVVAALFLDDAIIGAPGGEAYAGCGSPRLRCFGAGIVSERRGVVYYALDCDLAAEGIQSECRVEPGADQVDVAVLAVNDETTPPYVCPEPSDECEDGTPGINAFQFDVRNPDTSILFPPEVMGGAYDSNPNFNDALLTGNWNCDILPPDNDTGAGGPGTSASRLFCFEGIGGGATPAFVAEGDDVVLGIVTYNVLSSGSVSLTLEDVVSGDVFATEIGTCGAETAAPTLCLGATIHVPGTGVVVEFPTPTPGPMPIEISARACADFDGDGVVTIADVNAVVEHTGATGPEAARYDLNGNGKVTLVDALVASSRVGESC